MSDQKTLLPPNARNLELELEHLSYRLNGSAWPLTVLWNPISCEAHILPWLAWSFSIDEWDPNWSEDAKRAAIAASIPVHRRKGTIGAVKRALTATGYGDAEVIERYGWQHYNGAVTHDGSITYAPADHWAEYRVILERPITVEQAAQVRSILETVAPARSHLKALDFTEALNTYNARIDHDGLFTHGVA